MPIQCVNTGVVFALFASAGNFYAYDKKIPLLLSAHLIHIDLGIYQRQKGCDSFKEYLKGKPVT